MVGNLVNYEILAVIEGWIHRKAIDNEWLGYVVAEGDDDDESEEDELKKFFPKSGARRFLIGSFVHNL